MSSPWLSIPLADYEGHMSAGGVEQLDPLVRLFALALDRTSPGSVAILGIAGGNGLNVIDCARTTRVAGIDIHPEYLESVAARYGAGIPGLELHRADLAAERLAIRPVQLVHAALIFEHAGRDLCLENAIALVEERGFLSVVLQIPSETQHGVSPTPFPSIQTLKDKFQFIDPAAFTADLASRGLALELEVREPLPSGKAFWIGVFQRV